MLEEFQVSQTIATNLYYDNTSKMSLAHNPVFHARTKRRNRQSFYKWTCQVKWNCNASYQLGRSASRHTYQTSVHPEISNQLVSHTSIYLSKDCNYTDIWKYPYCYRNSFISLLLIYVIYPLHYLCISTLVHHKVSAVDKRELLAGALLFYPIFCYTMQLIILRFGRNEFLLMQKIALSWQLYGLILCYPFWNLVVHISNFIWYLNAHI